MVNIHGHCDITEYSIMFIVYCFTGVSGHGFNDFHWTPPTIECYSCEYRVNDTSPNEACGPNFNGVNAPVVKCNGTCTKSTSVESNGIGMYAL